MKFDLSTARRTDLLCNLGGYLAMQDPNWLDAQDRAVNTNAWFTPAHITLAINNIISCFLQRDKLEAWIAAYKPADVPKTVGIVMAGNIPLVGFHDFLCGFMSGNEVLLKLSSKDDVLLKFIIGKLGEWEPEVMQQVQIADRLNGCDAYIATGSNNTARYFEQYFASYPHLIRKNRTSVAVLDGNETDEELALLADDVYLYFGLGCRNVTQVYVPQGYNFERMLTVFKKYNEYAHHNKYKNNYDYHLAIYLLNRVLYMSNESLLMVENDMPFSAVSVLHYKYYNDKAALVQQLKASEDIQAIAGKDNVPFGKLQMPGLADYPDGVDTMAFLCGL